MSAQILSGKIFASEFKEEAKKQVLALKEQYNITPGLAVIIVGENTASKVYVNNKHRTCEEVGIYSEVISMPADTTKEQLIAKIDELNYRQEIHGILVQLPLPEAIAKEEADILNAICPLKDVDGFHPVNVGKLMIGQDTFVSCTPYGIIKMLEHYNIPVEGKHAVVIGRSNIVGKPLSHCLLNKNATVTICHSKTKNLSSITKNADILISAVGKLNMVTEDMVKDGAVVIDVGMNRDENGKLKGDVDFENVKNKASYITPVPGGVGPMTIAMLMNNVIKATKLQNDVKNI